MNTAKLRSKRVIVAGVAVAAALGVGGAVWGTAAYADQVTGGDRDRIANAATQVVPGTVTDVETSDDPGEAYEVDVRQADGSEVSVHLDKDLKVVSQERDNDGPDSDGPDDDDADDNAAGDAGTGTGGPDADDRVLSAEERASAEKAALDAVGAGSTILDLEASDDQGVAYEAEVRDSAGKEWDVDLDAAFKVVTKTEDN
ncbi:PepSY domain-containing protein [Actinoplanes sp. G11-F43]|uniref:PepSY domain-containing protein n=1 Tax=Actinoplanes sp. G11-F43 TaxID=3424130 RepID=UPI003D3265BC